jgi:uncharacterized protein
VKLYVIEDGTDDVRAFVSDASIVATSVIAYAEARAAFARRHREGALPRTGFMSAKRDFDRDWPSYLVLDVTDAIARRAGAWAERYRLRGYDSVHLATFAELAVRGGADVQFSSFDEQLNRAAAALHRQLRAGKALA